MSTGQLGRIPQGGLNITFKLKKSQPSTYGCHKGIMKIAPQTAFVTISPNYYRIFLPGFDKTGMMFDLSMEMPPFFTKTYKTKSN